MTPKEELERLASTPQVSRVEFFLAEIGRHRLLSAAEEVALAKRVERGDLAAKQQMINANLRLVVSIAKRYRGRGVPFLARVSPGRRMASGSASCAASGGGRSRVARAEGAG